MKPLGFDHRHESGPRGVLARWWYRRRVRRIRQARRAADLERSTLRLRDRR